MSFAFRRVSTMRKLMWASLAINLFLVGALVGNVVSGLSLLPSDMPPPPPFELAEKEPPGVRILRDVRSRLSDEGKVVFDAEFEAFIDELGSRPLPHELIRDLRETLRDPDASDAEIRNAYGQLGSSMTHEVTQVLEHMANAAIKLSQEDRHRMIPRGPGGMGPPPPR
ncbi:hypothetical protein [Thalassospira sp.]|uniref:hypothetical protein n=1 Tax=Thalassospira sp. TaxID=1912094 RepID=UPI003AA9A8C6